MKYIRQRWNQARRDARWGCVSHGLQAALPWLWLGGPYFIIYEKGRVRLAHACHYDTILMTNKLECFLLSLI